MSAALGLARSLLRENYYRLPPRRPPPEDCGAEGRGPDPPRARAKPPDDRLREELDAEEPRDEEEDEDLPTEGEDERELREMLGLREELLLLRLIELLDRLGMGRELVLTRGELNEGDEEEDLEERALEDREAVARLELADGDDTRERVGEEFRLRVALDWTPALLL